MFASILGFLKFLFGLDEAPQPAPATPTSVVSTTPQTARPVASIPQSKPVPASTEPQVPTDRQLTRAEVLALANYITTRYFPKVDPNMLVAMAWIESQYNHPNFRARAESHINDVSYGMMQVLTKTAIWMYEDLRATAFGYPTKTILNKPLASMYFGAAYVNWLVSYKGTPRSEEWIVRAYNGGPGWAVASASSKAKTLNHWTKYQKARGI